MTLLDQISEALGATGALGELSSTLGASTDETTSLLSAGLPAILGGLGAQADDDGVGALFDLLGDDGGSFVDSIGAFFGQGDKTGLASSLIGSLFGSQRGAIESHVANSSGGAISMVSRFLPMLAPAVMGLLGKITSDDGLDAAGLSEQLATVGADGPLGDILENAVDDDRAGFVQGITSLRDAGGLAALVPASSAAAPVAAAAAGAGGAAAQHLSGQDISGPAGESEEDRSGLGWLAPILLPLVALIAGLVLWQCTSTDSGVTEVVEVAEEAEEAEPAAEPEPAPTEVPAPTAVPEPTAAPEPSATPEPEPTAVPVVTIADLATGNGDLSTLVDIATQLGLAEAIADPDAGPFTIFAPTNDAFAAAGGVLERLDGDQTATSVTYHVVPGIYMASDLTPGTTLQTLAGETLTVADDGTIAGVQVVAADNVADNGVVHVVEQVLVPGSIQRFLATEDVNALFLLEPIQFASGSAEILAESVPTLDQAVETLSNVPAGTKFEVQGHTDTDGSADLNQTLSEARAASVVAYLTENGVAADILEPQGYGETQLKVDPETSPEDKAQNRRIEFVDISG